MLSRYTLVLSNNDFTALVGNIKSRNLASQTLSHKLELSAAVHQAEIVEHEEVGKNRLRRHADCFKQDGNWHLAATINTEIEQVFGVKFKVKPRPTIRNHAS